MQRKWLILLLIVLFLIEGTVMPWIIPDAWQTRIVPHFVFVVILFYAVYRHRYVGLGLGLIFGLLHDIVYYGHMIGVYSFSMGISAYLIGRLTGGKRIMFGWMMFIVLLGNCLFDTAVFAVYSLFRVTHQPYDWALLHHIIPSLFLQLLFALIVYVPVRRALDGDRKKTEEEEQ